MNKQTIRVLWARLRFTEGGEERVWPINMLTALIIIGVFCFFAGHIKNLW